MKMEEMNPTQLKEYLQIQMEQSKLPTAILDELVKENISGSIFLTLVDEDFMKISSSATFGVRKFFSIQISENKPLQPIKTYPAYVRTFNSEVKPIDKYCKGHCIDAYVNVRGKKTDPIRNFHLISDQDKDKSLQFIGSEVVPFVSACLTNRRNGTIYFGIRPSNDGQYKSGEIVGVNISKEEVQAEVNDFLEQSFLTSHRNLIFSTVRHAKFVPVISDAPKHQELKLWVVEFDVVPSSGAMDNSIIRTDLKCLPIHAKKHRSKEAAVFTFSSEGVPKIMSSDELFNYEKDQQQIVQQRLEEETAEQKCTQWSPNLRTRLLNLLTGGTEVMQDTIFTFLVTSSIDTHMDEQYLKENMNFIKILSPEVVYDFDPTGSTNGIYKNLDTVQDEVMRVLTTDNFDKKKVSKEEYKTLTEGLAEANRIAWMFCNGYETLSAEPMEPTEWNRKRRNAFQDCLKFYKDNFDENRIIVIICLFSKKYEVLIEACEEILTKLPENWILLAESDDTAKLWQHQILTRNKAEKQALTDRCVIGMPWDQVNQTIKQTIRTSDIQKECLLPTSTGAFVEIREEKLKDWFDIHVLSAGDFAVPENDKEIKKREVEERFYRGEQVSWLNFHFYNQVLKRDIHDKLINTVSEKLEGKGKEVEDKVTSVVILHQPGAGGTTSAKQVLWDMRKTYRCCIVNTITDNTCDQLDQLRMYNDSYPKPLLILIDNEDDDKCTSLIDRLEEKSRINSYSAEKSLNVYFTVILCIRRATLPRDVKHNQIVLRQELTHNELDWFKVKNKSLETQFNKDKEGNVNPKFLISFNILRENFNKEYISKVVKGFSDDVKSTEEVKLLKIISLLNTYDPYFGPVQVSCLDKILEHKQNTVTSGSNGTAKRNMKWEANLSEGIKVLLNLSSNKNHAGKPRNSLRVFNKNIAQEILTRMKERTGQKESEMMLELLESGIFEQGSSEKLQMLINNVMNKRESEPNRIKKEKFSRFVIYVKKTEGAEVAVNILKHLFKLNEHAFTAQLISRLYIEMKNWESAEHFATIATSMYPSNSFLWDTRGQVYVNQLTERISEEKFRDEDIHGLLELSRKCIKMFRKEQNVSENEITPNGENNFAGYFGELRAIVQILGALKMCPAFSNRHTLHKYLVDDNFNPQLLNFLNDEDVNYIKSLEKSSKETMQRLNEEYLQIKSDSNVMNGVFSSSDYNKKSLVELKVNLDEYFGETNDTVPQNLNETDTCDYIRRRVTHLGAKSLVSLLFLREGKQRNVIETIYSLILKNIRTKSCAFDDLKIILDTVTVLLIDGKVPNGLQFKTILEWCKTLYLKNKEQERDRYYLETYLYFVMYNFPTEERQKFRLCTTSDLTSVIDEWNVAFNKNYPKSGKENILRKRRETTLFFLGNGPPLHDIVHQDALDTMKQYNLSEKWNVPEVKDKLRMMSGNLHEGGEKVNMTITTREGNKFSFFIRTSHKVTKRDMWQKKVFFYIGFSFSGPTAFGMSTKELGTTEVHATRQ